MADIEVIRAEARLQELINKAGIDGPSSELIDEITRTCKTHLTLVKKENNQ